MIAGPEILVRFETYMSLVVRNLTKVYNQQLAVDDISFNVQAGEIVGFLGPNGAGKSTTMKIATTYLAASGGTIHVCDYDVATHPQEVKRCIGYLPEHNPLYSDMYIREYLLYVARLYHVPEPRRKVEEMIERCGLTAEHNKKIEQLSKGYRQRVGIAQALIHDPRVVILDEPTTGLDPNQILEIRKLITDVAKNKTVIFSTHIMQEVQAICDRVILINKGKIVADDQLSVLMNRGNANIFIVEFDTAVDPDVLKAIDGVSDVQAISSTQFRITSSHQDIRSQVFRTAAEKNLSLVGLRQEATSLESVFQDLTR